MTSTTGTDIVAQADADVKRAQMEALAQQEKQLGEALANVRREKYKLHDEASKAQRRADLARMSIFPSEGPEDDAQPGAGFVMIVQHVRDGKPAHTYRKVGNLGVPTRYGWHLGLSSSGMPTSSMLSWVGDELKYVTLDADRFKFHDIIAFQWLNSDFDMELAEAHYHTTARQPIRTEPFDMFFGDDWGVEEWDYSDMLKGD